MKNLLVAGFFLLSLLAVAGCGRASKTAQGPEPEIRPALATPGERAIPEIDGDLIKVNNLLCAVSRTPMGQETLGKFTGRVVYAGNNPKYRGKTFEFNYCCAMCQQMFPQKFAKDPDGVLRFHGLL